MLLTEFKTRLSQRAKAYVSDPDLVTTANITIAVTEALEIAGADNPAPVLMDIGFYRYLLLVEQNGVDEEQFKAYKHALNQISDPTSPNAPATRTVKNRHNPYL